MTEPARPTFTRYERRHLMCAVCLHPTRVELDLIFTTASGEPAEPVTLQGCETCNTGICARQG